MSSFIHFTSSLPRILEVNSMQETALDININDETDLAHLLCGYYMNDSIPIVSTEEDVEQHLSFLSDYRGEKYAELSFDVQYEILKQASRSVVLTYPQGLTVLHKWLLGGFDTRAATTCSTDDTEFRIRTVKLYCFPKNHASIILAIRLSSTPKGEYIASRFRQKFGNDSILTVSFCFPRMGLKSQIKIATDKEQLDRHFSLNPQDNPNQRQQDQMVADYDECIFFNYIIEQEMKKLGKESSGEMEKYYSKTEADEARHKMRVEMERQAWSLIAGYVQEKIPIEIGGYKFDMLCQNTSGMHSYKYVYFSPQLTSKGDAVTVDKARSWAIPTNDKNKELFSDDKSLKLLLRLALFNTPVIPTVQVEKFIVRPDDGEFTNGCGFISPRLAKEVFRKILEHKACTKKHVADGDEDMEYDEYDGVSYLREADCESYVPSAFQIRFLGAKGMLVQHPNVVEEFGCDLVLRESMVKIEYDTNDTDHILQTLEIVGYSSPCTFARLNSTILHILSGCTKKEKRDEMLENIKSIAKEHVYKTIDRYVDQDFSHVSDQYIKDDDFASLNVLAKSKNKKLAFLTGPFRNKIQSLRIPYSSARRLYGVVDPFGILQENEVFVQLSSYPDHTTKTIITGDIIVTKEPCVHRGDLRIVRAVEHDCFKKYLYDVIVFPSKGSKAISEQIAGSDLDGDQYLTMWENNMVCCVEQFESDTNNVKMEDEMRSFEPDVFKDLIGLRHAYADYYSYDWSRDKYWDTIMEKLSKLVNTAVDAPKQGLVSVAVRQQDFSLVTKFPGYPHYHKQKKGPLRESESLVGKVYDFMMDLLSVKLGFKKPNTKISITDDRNHIVTFVKYRLITNLHSLEKSFHEICQIFTATDQRIQLVSEFLNIFWRVYCCTGDHEGDMVLCCLKTPLKDLYNNRVFINLLTEKRVFIIQRSPNQKPLLLPGNELWEYYSIKNSEILPLFNDSLQRIQLDIGANCSNIQQQQLYHVAKTVIQQLQHYLKFNDPQTLFYYARLLLRYDCRRNNVDKALEILYSNIKKNHLLSIFQLGELYEKKNEFVNQNLSLAKELFKKAFDIGDKARASLKLGDLYYFDLKQKKKALKWYRKGAAFGCFTCETNVAKLRENSIPNLLNLAKHSDAQAQFELGSIYFNGEEAEPDNEKALHWYSKSAQSGNDDALVAIGELYELKGDLKNAMIYYSKAANNGNSLAKATIGLLMLRYNFEKAFTYLTSSAQDGNANAQYNLGVIYREGVSTKLKNDDATAMKWFGKAAIRGYAPAMYCLGEMYLQKNEEQARYWMKCAAKKKDTDAIEWCNKRGIDFNSVDETNIPQELWVLEIRQPTFINVKKR